MSPIKVKLASQEVATLGPTAESLQLTQLGKRIHYHGDGSGKAIITDEDGQNQVEFDLKAGDIRGIKIPVDIAPVEKGEPTTRVHWNLDLERKT